MQPNLPAWTTWLFPTVFVLLFIALWAAVCFVISRLSGWTTLSHRFRDVGAFYSYQWPFQSVRMRTIWGSYSNCVNFGADGTGLYMAVFPLFRPGHPPLFLPWSEIQVISGNQGFVLKTRKLLLGREELIPLRVRLSLAEKFQRAAGLAWPIEIIAA